MRGQDLSGEILDDRYRIVERIAAGAMGVVYRGTRIKLDRAVAIKVMHASLPGAMEGRKRFEREAQLMAKLEHPHCVSIIDAGLHGTKPYVVMELVRGRSLHDMIEEQGRFEIPRAIDLMGQILSGLAHAHEQGIIHRDIKPGNVMVTPKAPLGLHARILDFGLSRLVGASTSVSNGVAVGTPSYMAPEQCRGDAIDARIDIYACGVVLFEMLTGKKPFIADDPIAIVKKHLEQAPPRLADVVPGDYGGLEDVVARALQKSPDDRFQTALAMAEALEAVRAGRKASEPTAALAPQGSGPGSVEIPITIGSSVIQPVSSAQAEPPTSSALQRMLPVSRTRWAVIAALLASGAAMGGAIWYWYSASGEEDAAPVQPVIVAEPPPSPPPAVPPDPANVIVIDASKLAADGKLQAAIEMLIDARKVYPDHAGLAYTLGKLYFSKLWWADGLAQFGAAVRLDPALKTDPELQKAVLRGFLMTPGHDERLARFLVELGAPARPLVEEASRSHPNPKIRARATALLRRIR